MKSRKDNNKIDLLTLKQQYEIRPWKSTEVTSIHQTLERPNWAPWLSFSEEGMKGISTTFPEGQLVVLDKKNGDLMAYVSTNRIHWNGKLEDLPSWDSVAGGQVDQATFSNTYLPEGNTLAIMCLTVGAEHQGKNLPAILIEECRVLAKRLNITHIISPFRPSTYGKYKLENNDPGFKEYITMKREDGLPIDAWLRNLVRNGMEQLLVREDSLVVTVPKSVFLQYKSTHNPKSWKKISPNVWECGEVGQWFVEGDKATYREAELWGRIPVH